MLGQEFNVYTQEYEVLLEGEYDILFVVSPPGDHKYDPPIVDGVAVNVPEPPAHIVEFGMLIVGIGFTVIVPLTDELGQPFKVYTHAYEVVDDGLTLIEAVVAFPGDQR